MDRVSEGHLKVATTKVKRNQIKAAFQECEKKPRKKEEEEERQRQTRPDTCAHCAGTGTGMEKFI